MNDGFQRWKPRPALAELLPKLQGWLHSEQGQRLLASQQTMLDEALSGCFGYHLLQLSIDPSLELYGESRIQNKFRSHPLGSGTDTLADFEQLPFASESMDVVVSHHVQEFIDNPHELLRELQRVVMPNGQLIVIGFNPWSLMGAKSLLGRWLPPSRSPWHNHLISGWRMKDWLGLLGFEVKYRYFGHHRPQLLDSIEQPVINELLRSWPLGSFYMISAVKQVTQMSPIKPKWKLANPGFAALAPIKPGVRGGAASVSSLDKYRRQKTKDHN